jgi:Domain of unknown function (DUF4149)
VAYRALPRPQFSSLQQAIFPIYFSMQTALPVILALTYPGERTATSLRPSSLTGVFEPQNRLHVLTPLLTMFVTGLANLMAVGPATTKIMRERKHQGDYSSTHSKLWKPRAANLSQKLATARKAMTPDHIARRCRHSIGGLGECMDTRVC